MRGIKCNWVSLSFSRAGNQYHTFTMHQGRAGERHDLNARAHLQWLSIPGPTRVFVKLSSETRISPFTSAASCCAKAKPFSQTGYQGRRSSPNGVLVHRPSRVQLFRVHADWARGAICGLVRSGLLIHHQLQLPEWTSTSPETLRHLCSPPVKVTRLRLSSPNV